eukprot:jgi/Tetstr1/458222/TSEL_044710.t1
MEGGRGKGKMAKEIKTLQRRLQRTAAAKLKLKDKVWAINGEIGTLGKQLHREQAERQRDNERRESEGCEAAQDVLERAGFPKLLPNLCRGAISGPIRPAHQQVLWTFLDDTAYNLPVKKAAGMRTSPKVKELLLKVMTARSGLRAVKILRGAGSTGPGGLLEGEGVDVRFNLLIPSQNSIRSWIKKAKEEEQHRGNTPAAAKADTEEQHDGNTQAAAATQWAR